MLKVCLIASQAVLAQQTITLPDGRTLVDHVTILQPCLVAPDQMKSVFRSKAWKRVKELRKWSKLG